MTGGWEISESTNFILESIHYAFVIAILTAPIQICVWTLLLSPLCCCVGYFRKEWCCSCIHNIFLKITKYIFPFLKKEKEEYGFKVIGFVTPTCYTYFLVFTFCVITFHCVFAFLGDAIIINDLDVLNYSSLLDCSRRFNRTCIYYRVAHVLEIKLMEGFEGATFTLAVTVFFFAAVSISLVKLSGGRMRGNEMSCICKNINCCRRMIIILIQVVFVIVPRAAASFYLGYAQKYSPVQNSDYVLSYDDEQTGQNTAKLIDVSGLLDEESYFLLVAICDSISIGMLTPWYVFKRKGSEKTSYNLSMMARNASAHA